MKNIVYIATLFLIIAGLSGCEKEIKDFDGEEGVYFYVQWGVDWYDTTYWAAQPYTKVEFIKKGVDEQLLKIRVQATGRIKDYDRKFRIVVDQDSTTAVKGENYLEFDEWQTIKGGWSYADVPVTVKNSEALDEVERNLVLRLLPSEDFTLAIPQWFDLSGMVKEEEKEALRTDLIGLATEYTPISIIGSGGNINKLFRLADKKDKKASLLPIESLQDIYETLKALSTEQRIKQYKLKPDRADVIVPAAEIFLEIATHVKATGIIVPTIGLSDGIIDSLYTQNMNRPDSPQSR